LSKYTDTASSADGIAREVYMPALRTGETYLYGTASVLRDSIGNIVGAVESIRDITERKRSEQALAEEAIRRRILMEWSRDGIVVLDRNGKVYEANRRFAEMLGYSAEEMREFHVWDWNAELSKELLHERMQNTDAEGIIFETRHRRKDGTIYNVEICHNSVELAGQKLNLCVYRDISQRKAAEQALRDSEERLNLALAASRMGVWEWDVTTNNLFWSPECSNIFGVKSFDGKLESFADLVHPEDRDRVWLTIKQAAGRKNRLQTRVPHYPA